MMAATLLRILVVEDDKALLSILCDMLAGLGYHAVGVASAEEALIQLDTGSFNVLLSDINLPGMSGIDLASRAVAMVHGIRIIFSSGFGYLVTDRLEFSFQLLNKPYHLQELARAIRHSARQLSGAEQ
ncbi:response regulator [Noviherbaspirillum sp. Root189]|uniref:response regulator n=1 Tax=Noviherbaspirillum sp. Root189 TaxID=1736487 RepID=UPI000709E3D7|nr:response regulator [Noviherbaspirillum sp. Root189]KRB94174.1 hypothetical protein ASE07_01165 [Noviherbaspirillum sp. Root189]